MFYVMETLFDVFCYDYACANNYLVYMLPVVSFVVSFLMLHNVYILGDETKMRVTFVVMRWAGSTHDTWVFLDTLITYKATRINFHIHLKASSTSLISGILIKRKFSTLQGTKVSCACMATCLTSSGSKEVFIYAHTSLPNVIEWSFGVLKMKWCILLHLPSYPIEKQSKIIVVCMALRMACMMNILKPVEDISGVGSQVCWIPSSSS